MLSAGGRALDKIRWSNPTGPNQTPNAGMYRTGVRA